MNVIEKLKKGWVDLEELRSMSVSWWLFTQIVTVSLKKLDGIGSQRFVSIPVNKMADDNAGTSQKERVDDGKRIGSDGGWKIMVQVAN